MNNGLLTRTECTAMKGIAILGIMLHNFCHLLKDVVQENEYFWNENHVDMLLEELKQPDISLPIHLLSFFGHYGVPVFFFISGFGMVMKYEAGEKQESVSLWRFFRYNYLKLFRILIVGFAFFVMVDAITPNMHRFQFSEVLGMLGMYINFFAYPWKVIWPGPYWYFGVTLQLYLLYRLVIYRRHWSVVIILIGLCWLLQTWYMDGGIMRLRYNFVGGMLPFGLGVLLARAQQRQLSVSFGRWTYLLVFILSCALTFLMSLNGQAWLWAHVVIITGTIALVKLIPNLIQPYVLWVGSISAAIFVTHPIVRKIFLRPYFFDDQYVGLLLYVVATLVASWFMKKLIDQIPSPKL